ncbi:UDP-D-xylose:L-fucose alpha-1,3-D-xylosyltransferase-like [Mizuhopecten yessoensis]|uniref:UDP-D-xylose:L-fucose alpha-1,3-D-xylosyltransferase-like n=1 Tax=Mizuhopecten yessoensis TaxID=6573 RepID=UPI000B458362|nr:UDP-D-xylose:L-fucose alpha-1,3-D-xylosyltransferase-like [Mizuhopecten yessoensis]
MNKFSFKFRKLVVPFLIVCAIVLYIFFRRRSVQPAQHGGMFTGIQNKTPARSSYEVYYEKLEKELFSQEIVRSGRSIMKKSDIVLFGMLNDAYIPFTYSWLCNTLPMAIHGSVLLLTMDKNSTNLLKRDWPEVHTVHLPAKDFKGDQEYSKAGYVKMMHLRTQVINLLLRNKIPLLLFETDCLWISNPIPEVIQAVKGHDILAVKPTHKHGYLGGFMCLMPTEAALKVWGELSERMLSLHNSLTSLKDNEKVADETNDQVFFSSIMEQERKNIKVYEFSNKKIVDGKWYIDFTGKDRKEMRPFIINNNWVLGNKDKITRAKKWGHWFVSDSLQCNMMQVNKVIQL